MKTYTKPKDIKYVDMAIWIDENIYEKNHDQEKAFIYLYLLSDMLAHKHKFFSKESDYDDFALFSATKLYIRLTDKRQFKDNSKLVKIKSILNYLKSIIYPLKYKYECEILLNNTNQCDDYNLYCNFYTTHCTKDFTKTDFSLYLEDISKTIKQYLMTTPYAHTEEFNNIYLSCLLSFLNLITLDIAMQYKYNNMSNLEKVEKIYNQNSSDFVILYHLDDSMHDYIQLQVEKIKQLISEDISYIFKSEEYSDSVVKNMILSDIFEVDNGNSN